MTPGQYPNSLVGTTAKDRVGTGVIALSNGNYLVTSYWGANGAAPNAGAVTWGNGTTGVSGTMWCANGRVFKIILSSRQKTTDGWSAV